MNYELSGRLPFFWLIVTLFKVIREFFFIYLFLITLIKLFNFNIDVKSPFYLMLFFVFLKLVLKFFYWKNFKYFINIDYIKVHEGIFISSENTVPIDYIKEINEYKPLLYRMLGYSVLYFYTESNVNKGKLKLDVLGKDEISMINKILKSNSKDFFQLDEKNEKNTYVLSYSEMIKASFSPINILLFFMIIYSVFDKIQNFFNVSLYIKNIIHTVIHSIWELIIASLLYIILACFYNLIKTIILYRNYELRYDNIYIYISKGITNKTEITIQKERIQAVIIKNSIIQKVLGLIKLEIISNKNKDDNSAESNVIFPFISNVRFPMIFKTIFPKYSGNVRLKSIPKVAILFKITRLIIILGLLFLIIKTIIPFILPFFITLAILLIIGQIMNGLFSKYKITSDFIYYKKVNLTTKYLIIPRENIEEFSMNQSIFHRLFKLSSLKIVLRENPVKSINILEIPYSELNKFYNTI